MDDPFGGLKGAPLDSISSGQRDISQDRSLRRQNPQPRNCSDHTLVKLITLHYKCIKLESNYVGCNVDFSRRGD